MFRTALLSCVALTATLAAIWHHSSPEFARSAVTDPVLEIHNASLTNYLAAASSNQDVRPRATQRGVGIDGSLRNGSGFPLHIAGNPFEQGGGGAGMNEATGAFTISDVDIALPSKGFSWVIGRSYNAIQEDAGDHDSAGYQGNNWFQMSHPELVLYGSEGTPASTDVLYLVYGADRFIEMKRVSTSKVFRGVNGAHAVAEYDETSDIYTVTTPTDYQYVFFDFATTAAPGQLWKIVGPDRNDVAYAGHATTRALALSQGYSSGRMILAVDTNGREYTYTYASGLLERVTVEDGANEVARVEYTYYGSGVSHGLAGDLAIVEVWTEMTDSSQTDLKRNKYYRYYNDTWDSSIDWRKGHDHQIKMIVGFEGTRAYDWLDTVIGDKDYTSATDAALAEYSDAIFEYEENGRRITSATMAGVCGCSGGNPDAEILYSYESNETDDLGYDEDEWRTRTIVERPSANPDDLTGTDSWHTLYFDEVAQPLSTVISSAEPSTSSPTPDFWVTAVDRNADGCIYEVATPEAVTAYTHSNGAITTNTSSGLVTRFNRLSTGAAKNFLEYRTWYDGSSWLYLEELAYSTQHRDYTDGGSTSTLIRLSVSSRTTFPNETTTGAGGDTWSYSYNFHNDQGTDDSLAYEIVTTTQPVVQSQQNGPGGTALTSGVYYDQDGSRVATRTPLPYDSANDRIDYWAYTDGQMTQSVMDANSTGKGLPGSFSSSGTTLDVATDYTYDSVGRVDTISMRGGEQVIKHNYSYLIDARPATLRYPEFATGRYYGPASYTVTNQAGHVEFSATVEIPAAGVTTALASHIDDAEDDPIEAVHSSLGDLTNVQTQIYTESGHQVTETRSYHTTPTALPGSPASSYYDATTFTHNDLGQVLATVEPSGTIYETEYDLLGRRVKELIGTDNGSGTSNMLRTATYKYDGDGVGSGHLTELRRYTDATNFRETTYDYDVRGRLLLTTHPAAPHELVAYDNLGRVTARGLYAVAPASSADPTATSASNRRALTEMEYDTQGRVFRAKRQKINQTTGAITASSELVTDTWYDYAGGVVKVDGEQLVKYQVDRLGRRQKTFILAIDDDSPYADTHDVDGDRVLEEHHSIYDEESNVVVLEAVIQREHDDTTTGALDSNGDGDDFEYTIDDISGRLQATAHWYDDQLRRVETHRLGTNRDNDYTWTATIPTPGTHVLTNTMEYDLAGRMSKTTDPKGIDAEYSYDGAGRRTQVIRNKTGVGTPANPDENHTTDYTFTNGLMTRRVLRAASSADDQETVYHYGTTKGTNTGDSKIATGHLLQEIEYPDSTGSTDTVTMAYNAQSELIFREDQAGNQFDFSYDDRGRRTEVHASTIVTGFDDTIDIIDYTYTALGQLATVSQTDTTPNPDEVVDDITFTYDGWGMLATMDQDHDAQAAGYDYLIEWSYERETSGRNTARWTTMRYPSGTDVEADYTGTIPDAASRVASIAIDDGSTTTTVASYDYLGASSLVGRTLDDKDDIYQRLYNSSGYDNYLDEHNRVIRFRWSRQISSTEYNFVDYDLEYDKNSNLTEVLDRVLIDFDRTLTYDDLNRLTGYDEGTDPITTPVREESRTLNLQGQIESLTRDRPQADEDRTYTEANELTERDSPPGGTVEFNDIVWDAVGNLTDDDEDFEYVYDVFGRMVQVKEAGTTTVVANYVYNGLGMKIVQQEDTDGDGELTTDAWFHYIVDPAGRTIAVYRLNDADPKEEFVFHAAGTGELLLRDKDANNAWKQASDGVLERRDFFMADFEGSVVAVVDDLVERIGYSASGVPFAMPCGDVDCDGDVDSHDVSLISDQSTYDELYDLDWDGDVDKTDETIASGYSVTTLGSGVLSGVGSRVGWRQSTWEEEAGLLRFGRWLFMSDGTPLSGPQLWENRCKKILKMCEKRRRACLASGQSTAECDRQYTACIAPCTFDPGGGRSEPAGPEQPSSPAGPSGGGTSVGGPATPPPTTGTGTVAGEGSESGVGGGSSCVCLLCIHSSSNSRDHASDELPWNLMNGSCHAFLSLHVRCDNKWYIHTFGAFEQDIPVRPGGPPYRGASDVRVDSPFDLARLLHGTLYTHCIEIDCKKVSQVYGASRGHIWNKPYFGDNCAAWASDTFYDVTGVEIDPHGYFGIPNPVELGDNIIEANDGADQSENYPGAEGELDGTPADPSEMGLDGG